MHFSELPRNRESPYWYLRHSLRGRNEFLTENLNSPYWHLRLRSEAALALCNRYLSGVVPLRLPLFYFYCYYCYNFYHLC